MYITYWNENVHQYFATIVFEISSTAKPEHTGTNKDTNFTSFK